MNVSILFAKSSVTFAVVSTLLALVACTPAQAQQNDDRGPNVTIEGSPTAPCDVLGHLERTDLDGNNVIVQQGSTVPVTVKADAYGHNNSSPTHDLNRLTEVALYGTKVGVDVIPYRPGVGDNFHWRVSLPYRFAVAVMQG